MIKFSVTKIQYFSVYYMLYKLITYNTCKIINVSVNN
jgi:hypothetical protein